MNWENWSLRIRASYAIVCFSGSIFFYFCPLIVSATEPDYLLQSKVDVQRSQIDQLEAKTDAIERHLENTDKQVIENGNKIATINGAGMTCLGILGVLQTLGLLANSKANKGKG